MTYNVESRMASFRDLAFATATYGYDGDGQRVRKTTAAGTDTIYVHDAFGRLAAQYSESFATGGGIKYRTTDHLGTTRVVTDQSGAVVLSRRDYTPFGEEISASIGSRSTVTGYGSAAAVEQEFTSQIRDGESDLDYFLARYYSGPMGRFTGPDVPLLDQSPGNPQSWNLYGYVRSNPLAFVDPTGNQCFPSSTSAAADCGEIPEEVTVAVQDAGKHIVNTAVDAVNLLPNLFNFIGNAGGLPFIPAPTLDQPFEAPVV